MVFIKLNATFPGSSPKLSPPNFPAVYHFNSDQQGASKMSDANAEDAAKKLADESAQVQVDEDIGTEETKDSDSKENSISPKKQEEMLKKKYGGLLPKKPPLISKDHEHAFFDSADWALGKQGGQKNKGPLEALRPKLEPTPHHQAHSRLSAYSPIDNREDDGTSTSNPSEDESRTHPGDNDNREVSGDPKIHKNENTECS